MDGNGRSFVKRLKKKFKDLDLTCVEKLEQTSKLLPVSVRKIART
jgi:hypothetical protein